MTSSFIVVCLNQEIQHECSQCFSKHLFSERRRFVSDKSGVICESSVTFFTLSLQGERGTEKDNILPG